MRTNIEIDDKLIQEAFKYTSASTKKELVDLALREFVENHRRHDVSELLGNVKISLDYDYRDLRRDQEEN